MGRDRGGAAEARRGTSPTRSRSGRGRPGWTLDNRVDDRQWRRCQNFVLRSGIIPDCGGSFWNPRRRTRRARAAAIHARHGPDGIGRMQAVLGREDAAGEGTVSEFFGWEGIEVARRRPAGAHHPPDRDLEEAAPAGRWTTEWMTASGGGARTLF